jgi:WD40 repeat protein
MAFSADDRTIALGKYRLVHTYDVATGKQLRRFLGPPDLRDEIAAFAPDARSVAFADRFGSIRVWEVATGKERYTVRGPDPDVRAAFSAGGQKLVAVFGPFAPTGEPPGGCSTSLGVWDAASGWRLCFHRDVVKRMVKPFACSPDGKMLAAAIYHPEGEILLFCLETGRKLRALDWGESDLYALAFSPNGRALAAVGQDGVVRVWDVASGRQSHALRGHRGPVFAVCFSPDGGRLVTGGEDGTALIWDLSGRK